MSSRRKFLKTTSVAGLGMALMPSLISAPKTNTWDVIVIGAGLSGLMAARVLHQADAKVLVLEARDRVGGRTFNQEMTGGNIAEAGGQWIAPGQTEIRRLMRELGIKSFPSFMAGRAIGGGSMNKPQELAFARLESQIDELASVVPLEAPWLTPYAAEWDKMKVGKWLKKATDSMAVRLEMTYGIASFLSADVNDLSMLYFLFYVKSAGGIHNLLESAQDLRIRGGAQQISQKMATQLGEMIRLNTPVTSIKIENDEVLVTTNEKPLRAKRIIVAMMPKDAHKLGFDAPLPQQRQELMANWPTASGAKCSLLYPRPFWRSQGYSGDVFLASGPFSMGFDNSPSDASSGIFTCFANKKLLTLTKEDQQKTIIKELKRLWGPEANNVLDYALMDWAKESYTSGCVSPLGPGFLTAYGPALRTPVERIHWAGTETATVWNGYMEGAIRAGKRAADEVIAKIRQ